MKEKIIPPLNYLEACEYIKDKAQKEILDHLISIVVFGSYAMLVPTEYSDIDVLIIVDNISSEIEKRIKNIAIDFAFKFGRSLSPIILSSKDIKDSITAMDSFIIFVFWAHDILYDRNNWFKSQMDALQQRLVKIKKKIIFRQGPLVWTQEDLKILQEDTTKLQ